MVSAPGLAHPGQSKKELLLSLQMHSLLLWAPLPLLCSSAQRPVVRGCSFQGRLRTEPRFLWAFLVSRELKHRPEKDASEGPRPDS